MPPTDHATAYLLLLPGFDEQAMLDTLHTLHGIGRRLALIGFTRQPVCGTRGLQCHPDGSLEQVYRSRPEVVVIPGGAEAERLRTDPRLLTLLKNAVAAGGRVLAAAQPAYQLQRVGVPTHPLDQRKLDAFVRGRARQNGASRNRVPQAAYAPDYTML